MQIQRTNTMLVFISLRSNALYYIGLIKLCWAELGLFSKNEWVLGVKNNSDYCSLISRVLLVSLYLQTTFSTISRYFWRNLTADTCMFAYVCVRRQWNVGDKTALPCTRGLTRTQIAFPNNTDYFWVVFFHIYCSLFTPVAREQYWINFGTGPWLHKQGCYVYLNINFLTASFLGPGGDKTDQTYFQPLWFFRSPVMTVTKKGFLVI